MKKKISIFLTVVLLTGIVFNSGMFNWYKDTNLKAEDVTEEYVEDKVLEDSLIIEEIEEKREESVKHFRTDDGSIMAEIYPYAVHYKEDEANQEEPMKEINNNLVEGTNPEMEGAVYENTENSMKVSFAQEASDNKLVSVKEKGVGYSFRLYELEECQ